LTLLEDGDPSILQLFIDKEQTMTLSHPYRGGQAERPSTIPLPPAKLPLFYQGHLRKQWRYVSIWSADISICAARIKVGPVAQEFWAVWDRAAGQLWEKTRLRSACVHLTPGRLRVEDGHVSIDVSLAENDGFEVVTPVGRAYTWTRKQCAIRAHGHVRLNGEKQPVEAIALIDDNAGYHPRQTLWQWCGGAGQDSDGRSVAWSFIVGLNDSPHNSERTIWLNGRPQETGPVRFADDLTAVYFDSGETLHFKAEAVRQRRDNLLLIRSAYRQPFGTFSGTLPGGITLRTGYGVMEWHQATW
jgi:hypothetical protein